MKELIFEIVELYFARLPLDAQSRVVTAMANIRQHDVWQLDAAYSTDEAYYLAWTRTYSDLQVTCRSAVQDVKRAGEAWHLWRRAWNRICP